MWQNWHFGGRVYHFLFKKGKEREPFLILGQCGVGVNICSEFSYKFFKCHLRLWGVSVKICPSIFRMEEQIFIKSYINEFFWNLWFKSDNNNWHVACQLLLSNNNNNWHVAWKSTCIPARHGEVIGVASVGYLCYHG